MNQMPSRHTFFLREHGATAMLLTPFVSSAVLSRAVRWQEGAAIAAVVAAFAMKDPLVVLARQRWVWKQPHAETRAAWRWVAGEAAALTVCGLALMATGPLAAYLVLFCGAAAFSALAVWINVHNRQRAIWFQIVSALALTSTSLTAAVAATGAIPGWCWQLWLLLAAQAAAGIFTVHARLEARIDRAGSRRPALVFVALLALGGLAAVAAARYWIGGALLFAAVGFAQDLRRQLNPESLRTPLTAVGMQTLCLSLIYAAIVVAGLW